MEKREEREQRIQWWRLQRREAGKKHSLIQISQRLQILSSKDETTEERNDVYLYKTLRYPSTATPPTAE